GRHPQSTTAVPLAILVGSRPAAPTLASGRQSRPHSRREPGRAASVRRVYSCTHRRSLGKSDSVDRRAPISSSLAPRPNPHSVRCTAATHLPRPPPLSNPPSAAAPPPPPPPRVFVLGLSSPPARHSPWMTSSSRRPRN